MLSDQWLLVRGRCDHDPSTPALQPTMPIPCVVIAIAIPKRYTTSAVAPHQHDYPTSIADGISFDLLGVGQQPV